MLANHKIILFFLIICNYQISNAQVIPEKKDSSEVYRKIEKYSKKRKFTTFVYKLIFEPVSKPKIKKNSFHKIKKQYYTPFDGKIIRNIKITTLDPFGYSATDTAAKPEQFILKAGNTLHIKTNNLAIRNLLLVKRNTPLDTLLLKESERLIRSQRYISSVVIKPELVSKDSVDVNIRVLDAWSAVPDFSISGSKSSFYLTDKNFFGTGHEFSNSYVTNLSNNQEGYSTRYTIPNIMNTFIKTTFNYSIDLDGNFSKFINIERPFFSPFARWGAGAYFDQQYGKVVTSISNQIIEKEYFKYNSQDYWAGHSFQIFKGNSEYQRTTNFITTARYFSKYYLESPQKNVDNLGIYSSEKLYLIGVGISSRKYVQDKYIFNFNVIEDIATGFVYNLTAGYQNKNNDYRFYCGGKAVFGTYFDFGYLSTNFEYGTFLKDSKTTQSAFVFSAVYFTNLLETGSWKFRQFIKPELVIGGNRLNTIADKLNLNGETGIQGFSSETLYGTKKILTTFQTQGYSPWRVFGFRLNPYFSVTLGLLGEDLGFNKSKLYTQLGTGIILSNDYLVFSSFQFSFSYYPNIPIDGGSIFKTNAIKTYDLGLQNFEIAKPLIANYK
jgi:hypothetical protein